MQEELAKVVCANAELGLEATQLRVRRAGCFSVCSAMLRTDSEGGCLQVQLRCTARVKFAASLGIVGACLAVYNPN